MMLKYLACLLLALPLTAMAAWAQNPAMDARINETIKKLPLLKNPGTPLDKELNATLDKLKAGKNREAEKFFRSALNVAEKQSTLSGKALDSVIFFSALVTSRRAQDFIAQNPVMTPAVRSRYKVEVIQPSASDTNRLLRLSYKYKAKGDPGTAKLRAQYDSLVKILNGTN